MAKNIRWQIPFVSIQGVHYRVDIYDEGTFTPVELTAGPTPFVTDEDASDDFFCPVRSQSGTLQVCTLLPNTTDQYITLDDLLPANNIARPVRLINRDNSDAIEWQGFLSCEAYSQDYTGIPQILDVPVISVLEAMKSIGLGSQTFGQGSMYTIEDVIDNIAQQVEDTTGVHVLTVTSGATQDALSKYIYTSQFISYETENVLGEDSYIQKPLTIYEILERICKFFGWVLREQADTLYFVRNWTDEIDTTSANMDDLEWMGTEHSRDILSGARKVSISTNLGKFATNFEMPKCPMLGLTQYFFDVYANDWYYDKCSKTSVGMFTSTDISKCFLSRFYRMRRNSSYFFDFIYYNLSFDNAIYLIGQKYTDTSYKKLCSIRTPIDFGYIVGRQGSGEDIGHFTFKVTDKLASVAPVSVNNSYIRCGIRWGNLYCGGPNSFDWTAGFIASFKLNLTNGVGELDIDIPKLFYSQTQFVGVLEVSLYDDFNTGRNTALITNISLDYVSPVVKGFEKKTENKYVQALNESRDEINIDTKLASSLGEICNPSLIYERKVQPITGEDPYYYFDPITALSYIKADTTTESRRPEVDLLNRLAAYYGAARQRLELEVKHPTAAPLPLLKLNGINDGKVYLPLSESRDWQTDVCKLTCFECPT